MKLVIIGAMAEEIAFIIEKLDNIEKKEINKFTFYIGTLYDRELIVVESGVGKVMAGVLIATLVNNFKDIGKIINVGVAGGVGDLEIGDIVVGLNYVYGDANLSVFDGKYRYGQMAGCPFMFQASKDLIAVTKQLHPLYGTICTTDQFMVDTNVISNLITNYFSDINIRCFDMESTAFAHSCYFYGIDFIAIRAISDVIGTPQQNKSFTENLETAAVNSNLFVIELLKFLS